jgi:hypothetical protein
MPWYVAYKPSNKPDFTRTPYSAHRETALQQAFALHQRGNDVFRIVGPDGNIIDRAEFEQLYQLDLARHRARPAQHRPAEEQRP